MFIALYYVVSRHDTHKMLTEIIQRIYILYGSNRYFISFNEIYLIEVIDNILYDVIFDFLCEINYEERYYLFYSYQLEETTAFKSINSHRQYLNCSKGYC